MNVRRFHGSGLELRLGRPGLRRDGRDNGRHGLDDVVDDAQRPGRRQAGEDPVEVLKTRYSRGELTTEEFQERLRTIEDPRG